MNRIDGYHQNRLRDIEIATLPDYWHYRDGLKYPTTITLTDGTIQEFKTYMEHYYFISNLFTPKKNENRNNNRT